MIKTIKLSAPIKTPRGDIAELQFREPRFSDWQKIGSPRAHIIAGDSVCPHILEPVLCTWIETLAQDIDINFLGTMTMRDTHKVREAVLDFLFPSDEAAPTTATAAPLTTSFSPSDATFEPSKI